MKHVGFLLLVCCILASLSFARDTKAKKPLSGYKSITIEPFTVESSGETKDFPNGEEANLWRSSIETIRGARIFQNVLDSSPEEVPSAAPGEPAEHLLLRTTIIGFTKGDSASRFMTWPLPVGVSKVKVRFIFVDPSTKDSVYAFEKEVKFQALVSGGIATEQQQMGHLKSNLADALLKEIKRNR